MIAMKATTVLSPLLQHAEVRDASQVGKASHQPPLAGKTLHFYINCD